MIQLPDFEASFEYENNFYLSCSPNRIAKVLAHYELYKMVKDLPGQVVECGVFKGASFSRFAMFRELFETPYSKKLIGFDTFGKFPETEFPQDKIPRERFIESAGDKSISMKQLGMVLEYKGIKSNVELVPGNILETVPKYLYEHPELKISLLNLDTDVYEPAVVILEHLFPRLVKGGVLIIDDYGVFPGETKAVDEYFQNSPFDIKKFSYCMTPCFVIKTE
ncbi:MAG: TylF/MycF/NovP-related O-methyltransferase [Bacteroidota bacterium]